MQLEQMKLHSCGAYAAAESQITLDDDVNVPDYRPDIVKVLREKGELQFDEVKAAAGAVWLKGRLIFRVLYKSDEENAKISCLRGEIPFQEKINMDGVQEYDPVQASGGIEDLTVGVIHSRKISVRAVVLLAVKEQREAEAALCTGTAGGDGCERKYRVVRALQLLCMKHDICRRKNEIALPSAKPNVREVLWKSMEMRGMEAHFGRDGVTLSGELLVCVLYQEEEENGRVQWYETAVPLDCHADCDAGAQEDVIAKIEVTPVSAEIDVKPDYDGEERVLSAEFTAALDIRVWKEQEIRLLEDVYSLGKELVPEREPVEIPRILVKNESQCRLNERLELSEGEEKLLQICSCEGTVHLEKTELTPQGLRAEGVLIAELLYATADDALPIASVRGIYPFEQLIEIPEAAQNTKVETECRIGQLSAVMLDQDHVEIKAVIQIDALAFAGETVQNITEIREEPLDVEALRRRPGLIGYIAKDGDTLWAIAKQNHTTTEQIRKDNGRTDDALRRGERILVVKKVET